MLPAQTTIGFVHLTVADLDATLPFYRDLLGFWPAGTFGPSALLSADGSYPYHILLTPAPGAARPPRRSAGLYHLAILLPSRADLGAIVRRVLEAGWPVQGASDHGVSEAVYLSDPEGNGIELYADRPRERWPRLGAGITMPTRPLDLDSLLAAAAPWQGLPARTTIGHVHLRVSDLDRAEAFYAGALGFEVMVRTYPGALFFAAGGYHHHLGVNIWAGSSLLPADPDRPGLRAFAVRLPERSALAAAAARLRSAGAALSVVDHGACLAVYTRDPDGIPLALTVDAPAPAPWKAEPLPPEAIPA